MAEEIKLQQITAMAGGDGKPIIFGLGTDGKVYKCSDDGTGASDWWSIGMRLNK